MHLHHRTRAALIGVVLVVVVATASACLPPPVGPYLDPDPATRPVVTPRDAGIVWGEAPSIDPGYGGLLYPGTRRQRQDPRPPLDDEGNQPLRLWVADPADGATGRPAIVWLHGGSFVHGIDGMWGLASTTGQEYARRGFVGFSVEYRIDTRLIQTPTGPEILCQWVQDNEDPSDPTWLARKDRCRQNMLAAVQDTLAVVRYLRAHADEYGIDPDRIAVGGFSAGAIIANGTAYRWEDPGSTPYFDGDPVEAAASRPRAAFGASGCLYSNSRSGALPEIGAGDAPLSMIASGNDRAVDYSCTANSVRKARNRGLVAELTSYCDSDLHSAALRAANKTATDRQWTQFLARELGLRSDLPPATQAPLCPV